MGIKEAAKILLVIYKNYFRRRHFKKLEVNSRFSFRRGFIKMKDIPSIQAEFLLIT